MSGRGNAFASMLQSETAHWKRVRKWQRKGRIHRHSVFTRKLSCIAGQGRVLGRGVTLLHSG
jgi:hypothetical protein